MPAVLLALTLAGARPAPAEAAFNARVCQSVAAAETLQGPLDGGWTLFVHGRPLYVFQIADPAGGGPIQAAWRDGSPDAATDPGVVSEAYRAGPSLRLSFRRGGVAPLTVVRLRGDASHGWRGDIVEGNHTAAAVLRRNRSWGDSPCGRGPSGLDRAPTLAVTP